MQDTLCSRSSMFKIMVSRWNAFLKWLTGQLGEWRAFGRLALSTLNQELEGDMITAYKYKDQCRRRAFQTKGQQYSTDEEILA